MERYRSLTGMLSLESLRGINCYLQALSLEGEGPSPLKSRPVKKTLD